MYAPCVNSLFLMVWPYLKAGCPSQGCALALVAGPWRVELTLGQFTVCYYLPARLAGSSVVFMSTLILSIHHK